MKSQFIPRFLLLSLLLSSCAGAPPAADVSTSIPAPTVSPTIATAIANDFPAGSPDYASEEQPAGYYKAPAWFSIPFTFDTTEAFRGMAEVLPQGQLFGIAQGERVLPAKQLIFWILAPDISTEAAISQLHEAPSLEFTSNETVTVAGISGTQFDTTYDGAGKLVIPLGALVGVGNRNWTTNSPGVHLRLIVLSHPARTILVYIEAPEAEFEDFIAKANKVLETVHFSPQE
jgi:hypothetical protein